MAERDLHAQAGAPRACRHALAPGQETQGVTYHTNVCVAATPWVSTASRGAPLLTNFSPQREPSLRCSSSLTAKPILEVFDPDFKFIYDVPTHCVVHLPPARLNITRLVLCRNYRRYEPQSCTMGGGCKFVHADCDYAQLEAHPIHVNYIWRQEELCTYPRLPAGHRFEVWAPNEKSPAALIASERILVTKGSQAFMIMHQSVQSGLASAAELERYPPLSHCAHYYFNRMCNRGERCNFIHAVHVDPNVQGDFKRAPLRAQHAAARGSKHEELACSTGLPARCGGSRTKAASRGSSAASGSTLVAGGNVDRQQQLVGGDPRGAMPNSAPPQPLNSRGAARRQVLAFTAAMTSPLPSVLCESAASKTVDSDSLLPSSLAPPPPTPLVKGGGNVDTGRGNRNASRTELRPPPLVVSGIGCSDGPIVESEDRVLSRRAGEGERTAITTITNTTAAAPTAAAAGRGGRSGQSFSNCCHSLASPSSLCLSRGVPAATLSAATSGPSGTPISHHFPHFTPKSPLMWLAHGDSFNTHLSAPAYSSSHHTDPASLSCTAVSADHECWLVSNNSSRRGHAASSLVDVPAPAVNVIARRCRRRPGPPLSAASAAASPTFPNTTAAIGMDPRLLDNVSGAPFAPALASPPLPFVSARAVQGSAGGAGGRRGLTLGPRHRLEDSAPGGTRCPSGAARPGDTTAEKMGRVYREGLHPAGSNSVASTHGCEVPCGDSLLAMEGNASSTVVTTVTALWPPSSPACGGSSCSTGGPSLGLPDTPFRGGGVGSPVDAAAVVRAEMYGAVCDGGPAGVMAAMTGPCFPSQALLSRRSQLPSEGTCGAPPPPVLTHSYLRKADIDDDEDDRSNSKNESVTVSRASEYRHDPYMHVNFVRQLTGGREEC